jgi:hypothetical protein
VAVVNRIGNIVELVESVLTKHPKVLEALRRGESVNVVRESLRRATDKSTGGMLEFSRAIGARHHPRPNMVRIIKGACESRLVVSKSRWTVSIPSTATAASTPWSKSRMPASDLNGSTVTNATITR